MCRINRVLSLRLSVAVMLILLLLVTEATVTHAQGPCTDGEIWAVFPTSRDLGDVNDQLLTKSGPTLNKDGTRMFSMRWQGAASSRSVSVTLTEYLKPKEASKKVHAYGFDSAKGQTKSGMVKLGFGDEGYKTDDRKRPYYLVHKGQFGISYYTSYPGRSGGSPGNQDPTVAKIIKKIAALPCLGLTVQPPPPPPVNNCPKVTLTASPPRATPSQTITLVAKATDPEGDPLTMKWSVTDSQGKTIRVAWNGKVTTGNAQMTDTVAWKNPPAGQYKISVSVSDGKCGKAEKAATSVLVQAGMVVGVTTDKKVYSPGENVIIKGFVKNEKGGIDGAAVAVNVQGTSLTATTDPFGNYTCPPFPIPPTFNPINYKVVATATYSGYPDKSQSTIFSVGKKELLVKISTDKNNYLIGETVKCTITVTDSQGVEVPNADLTITAARLKSGKNPVVSYGVTDPSGKFFCTFPWGKKTAGKPIIEGKLKVDVRAKLLARSAKEANAEGFNSIMVRGCGDGDLECSNQKEYCEDCFTCPEDCPCKPEEICDPTSTQSDAKTKCSPKMAYVFVSENSKHGLTSWEFFLLAPKIKAVTLNFRSFNYYTLIMNSKKFTDVLKYLAKPSTKALAWFGHGGFPSIESNGVMGGHDRKNFINNVKQQYIDNFKKVLSVGKFKENKAEIIKAAHERSQRPEFFFVYNHSCYSLQNTSLADYLLEPGGEYYGADGSIGCLSILKPYIKK